MTERQTREQRAAEEALRRTNPLQITCVECWNVCVLSKDGKRWLCQRGHGNERIDEQAEYWISSTMEDVRVVPRYRVEHGGCLGC